MAHQVARWDGARVRLHGLLGWTGHLLRYLVSSCCSSLALSSALKKLTALLARVFSSDPFSANSRHSYSFPRIYGIMNDGKKSYDVGKDGQGQEIGSCSVRRWLQGVGS